MIDDPALPAPQRRPSPEDGSSAHASWQLPPFDDPSAVGSDARDRTASGWDVIAPVGQGTGALDLGALDPVVPGAGARDTGQSGTGAPHDARPLTLRLLRPWFEPRPGELRGAIVLLTLALAVSVALWFDASRRPTSAPQGLPPIASASSGPAGTAQGGTTPGGPGADGISAAPGAQGDGGRADGSDGWGLGADVAAGPVVHGSGAVVRPGVVTLPTGARVTDAIEQAGGAMPDARLDRLNLARPVEDGEQVHVPRVGEDAPPPSEPASRGVLPDGRIDLNAASQAELETLPGVGPARAQAIIAEREERPFRVPGDLRRVPGIGEATFQRLAPLVAVR